MQVTLRKIGNSKGVIIPAAFTEQLGMDNEVELVIRNGELVLKPVLSTRQGWFDNYQPQQDVAVLGDMKDIASEQDEWEW